MNNDLIGREEMKKLFEKEQNKKKCEYCTGDIDDRPYLDSMKWYISNCATLINDETDHDEIRIKYCPMCGRQLEKVGNEAD